MKALVQWQPPMTMALWGRQCHHINNTDKTWHKFTDTLWGDSHTPVCLHAGCNIYSNQGKNTNNVWACAPAGTPHFKLILDLLLGLRRSVSVKAKPPAVSQSEYSTVLCLTLLVLVDLSRSWVGSGWLAEDSLAVQVQISAKQKKSVHDWRQEINLTKVVKWHEVCLIC